MAGDSVNVRTLRRVFGEFLSVPNLRPDRKAVVMFQKMVKTITFLNAQPG